MHPPRVHTTAHWIDQGDSILGQLAGLDVNPGPSAIQAFILI